MQKQQQLNLDKALINVKAFLPEDNEIISIIKICDLEPLEDWKHWVDFNGNNLTIKQNKSIILTKDIPTKKINKKIKDIYYKAPINSISKNSKFALIAFAKSTNSEKINICFIWFLGKDDKLRLSILLKNEWIENQPPLLTSIATIRIIIKNLNIEKFKKIKPSLIKGPLSSNIENAWVTQWPPSNNLLLDLIFTNQLMANNLINDCNLKRNN